MSKSNHEKFEVAGLWGYDDAAARLGIPKGTLYAKVSRNEIPHLRLGPRLVRFRPEDIEVWLQSRAVEVLP